MLQFLRLHSTFKFLLVAALCLQGRADVIHLKNGGRIVADSTRETDGRIEYTIGENTFSIPKKVVERIDTGPGTEVPGKSAAPLPDLPPPPEPAANNGDLVSRVIHGGQVDPAALKAIEAEGNAERTAAANLIAGNFEEKAGHLPAAALYMQAAVRLAPENAIYLERYGIVLIQLGQYSEGLAYAQKAARADPQSPDAFTLLGFAHYKNDHNEDAITALKKSLALKPDDRVKAFLQRVERESNVEARFREQQKGHFLLRFEGSEVPDTLRDEILSTLESQFNALQNDLGGALQSVSVTLYTGQAFFDVTQAPAWSAALNDGKLRIPVSGMTEMTPALTRVLHHELTHSFVRQITHGNVPQWLNEGLAELEEPSSTAPMGARLASLYAAGRQVQLNQLEQSFLSYGTGEATVAYAEALAAVECIRVNHGMESIAALLQHLGRGEAIESALRSTIHGGYSQLESEIAEYLKRKYGD